jgi:multidrug resistance efflux pump
MGMMRMIPIKRKPIGAFSRAGKLFVLVLGLALLLQPAEFGVEASPVQTAGLQTAGLQTAGLQIAGVQTAQGMQTTEAVGLNLDGNLAPRKWVNVGFSQGGEIVELLVKEGDEVQAGQMLARQDHLESLQAAIDADQVKLLNAQKALKDLEDGAAQQLALIDQSIAEADRQRALADSRVRSLQKLPDPIAVQQAFGNMKTREKDLENQQKALTKAQKLWDPKSFIWRFIPRHAYKLYLMSLESAVAQAQVRYQDSVDAYIKRQKPADPVDIALAQAQLSLAEAQVQKGQQDRVRWQNGADPDQVAVLKARIQAAQSALAADQARLEASRLVAPIAGKVVSLALKQGEWAAPNQTVMVIADQSSWQIDLGDLTEDQVVALKPGMPLTVSFEALPGATFNSQLESIDMVYITKNGDTRFTAKADLQGNDPRLRWGMSATLETNNN